MKLKIALATATALGMTMGMAWAGSSNTLYISQSGSDNTATVHQSGDGIAAHAAGGNDIGKLRAPVVQDGQRNYLSYTNERYGAGSDNDIVKLKQDGSDNYFSATDYNGAAHTRINNVLQDGSNNRTFARRVGEQSSTIDRMSMTGSNNSVWISQGPTIYYPPYGPAGGNNTVSLVKIDGNNNGFQVNNGVDAGYLGIYIDQQGSSTAGGIYNTITEASIEGSNNHVGYGSPVISIKQHGSYNGRTASIARVKGSNGNGIVVAETGDWNNFDVRQGVSASSTGNYATVSQLGSSNSATATQYGNGNSLTVNQNGDSNTSTTLFNGSYNGVNSLSGAAGTLQTASMDLTQGTVFQDSNSALHGNSLSYDVHGSNNSFAFAQIGGSNTIDGSVGTGSHYSSNNQVAVLQSGNSNTSSFSQTGAGGNNLAVSQ